MQKKKKNIHTLSVLSSALLASALKYAKLQFIDLRRFRVVAKAPITFATPVHMSIFPSVSLSVRPSVCTDVSERLPPTLFL
jgi:hypothetical protein